MTIDGLSPSRIARPQTIEELSELVALEKGSLVPFGACTQLSFGNPLLRADCGVDLSGLSRITEYIPADLTIHVEAGVTLGQLHHTLQENRQFLPLDPWNGPSATIGGIAAANAQGSFRTVGTIRDWIIGMKVVEPGGKISKAGGRVVKNVTGYDLHKLYTGSLGTLAMIAEISLKLRSTFERTATAVGRFANKADAAACLASLRKSVLQPVACEWVGPGNTIGLRFGDNAKAVDWQLKNLPPEADWVVMEDATEAAVWDDLRASYNAFEPIVLRVIGHPTQVHEIIEEYRPAGWIAHALTGVVLMRLDSPADVLRVRQKYRAVIEKAPIDVRRQMATFGLSRAEYDLMKKMKAAFDPEERLNPGRHVDGEEPTVINR